MAETPAQQIARLMRELTRLVARRNQLQASDPTSPWIGELTKDIADIRAVIAQLEAAVRAGHK